MYKARLLYRSPQYPIFCRRGDESPGHCFFFILQLLKYQPPYQASLRILAVLNYKQCVVFNRITSYVEEAERRGEELQYYQGNGCAVSSGRSGCAFMRYALRSARLCLPVVLALLCSACTDPDRTRIANACVNAASQGAASNSVSISSRCDCVARSAKKYLDRSDYALLAKASSAYMSTEDDETKLHDIVNSLVEISGVSPTRAGLTAMDFVFLAHKIDDECHE